MLRVFVNQLYPSAFGKNQNVVPLCIIFIGLLYQPWSNSLSTVSDYIFCAQSLIFIICVSDLQDSESDGR